MFDVKSPNYIFVCFIILPLWSKYPGDLDTMSTDAAPTSVSLNIGTSEEKEEFLKTIHPDFLQMVDPWDVADHMTAAGLLTDDDKDSLLRNACTPKELRRKVWFMLTNLSVTELKRKVFPKLLELYPHIIPEKFITQEADELDMNIHDDAQRKECLRHEIMRQFRPRTVLDKMYHYGCLRLDQYRSCFKNGYAADQPWEMLFKVCPQNPEMMKDLLKEHRMSVPDDFDFLLSRACPCSCKSRASHLPDSPLSMSRRKVDSEIRNPPFAVDPMPSDRTRNTESSNVFSNISADKFQKPESATNKDDSFVPYCSPSAVPMPGARYKKIDYFNFGRERENANVLSVRLYLNSPGISDPAGWPNPSVKTDDRQLLAESGENNNTVLVPLAKPLLMEVNVIQGDESLNTDRAFPAEDSVKRIPKKQRGCSFIDMLMSILAELRYSRKHTA